MTFETAAEAYLWMEETLTRIINSPGSKISEQIQAVDALRRVVKDKFGLVPLLSPFVNQIELD